MQRLISERVPAPPPPPTGSNGALGAHNVAALSHLLLFHMESSCCCFFSFLTFPAAGLAPTRAKIAVCEARERRRPLPHQSAGETAAN